LVQKAVLFPLNVVKRNLEKSFNHKEPTLSSVRHQLKKEKRKKTRGEMEEELKRSNVAQYPLRMSLTPGSAFA
jgi:hypothetical protein